MRHAFWPLVLLATSAIFEVPSIHTQLGKI